MTTTRAQANPDGTMLLTVTTLARPTVRNAMIRRRGEEAEG